MRSKNLTPVAVTRYLPQFFVGYFYVAAAYIKATSGLFGAHSPSLAWIVEGWKSTSHFMPHYYFWFADHVIIPYAAFFSVAVILMQGVAGILLIANRWTRFAGVLIFFVQLNILLAVFNQLELRVFNSLAMLVGLYYFARPVMQGTLWKLMTYAIVLNGFIHLYGRLSLFSDPLHDTYFWQRSHYSAYVMASWPGLKYFTLWLTSGENGSLIWTSTWWVKLALLAGMLTRYRLQAGVMWLLLVTAITLAWLNAFSCEGTFWVLTMFLWVVHEHELQASSPTKPVSYLP